MAVAAKGYKKVNSAEIANISEDKKDLGKIENITCDCICVSGFWTPTIHLASQSGNKTKFNEEIDTYCETLQHFIQKDRGLSISDAPIGCDFEIGDDYSMGKFDKQYGDYMNDSYIQNSG